MDEQFKVKNNKKLIYYGKAAFIISLAIFLSFFLVKDFGVIWNELIDALNKFFKTLTPLTIGIIFAYILNKPVMLVEKILKKLKHRRELSIAIVYIFIISIISLFINFIVPGIQKSLIQLVNLDISGYTDVISQNIDGIIYKLENLGFNIDYSKFDYTSLEDYLLKVTNISSIVLDNLMSFIKNFTQGIFYVLLALVLSFYILQKKERILYSVKELILLYGNEKIKYSIIDEIKRFNIILNSYISGVLTDAFTVLMLSTIALSIIGHRYFLLMGVLLGLFNMIPYFGAIIGCALAALLALLFQGIPKMIYTLIVLILIQQLDGNIIQPKIIGNKVGLEPLWVITAVLIFGSYWGVIGMILAVPFTALFKTIFVRLVEKKRNEVAITKEDKK